MDNLFDNISQKIIQIPRDNLVFFSLISLVIALIINDVSQYIQDNGSYKVKWEYSSGCCGIFIDGVDLLEVK
ncbi:hypothetical protein WH8501_26195 [Crocosphaera watsonii WH 8501]|uniref:Uncharacterized protein n=5 Tax=Crocosphaera watsonii TaxID=263511 RepID=T2JT77_CROWT|nr:MULTISPECIES: hypothetical protein [Crocosphaera]EHJ12719.1 hypothetical protein CWATWH0003_2551 [Crocosphaera watsonii WH 0003]MCH2243651.1 hypothetical protein [Crocosphaera sp.]NQZ64277.1 hypothetical protein [Crocosphaera sp.]CCQ51122.1 hypothetical protein CWATWH8502_2553 [Crocosphaera watsonii WH 8502]CCQ58322.1 hypothetical protein CWATWH0005_3130 [Crocosphaera watsonii WH 0005]